MFFAVIVTYLALDIPEPPTEPPPDAQLPPLEA
jgi:hypothetical protein